MNRFWKKLCSGIALGLLAGTGTVSAQEPEVLAVQPTPVKQEKASATVTPAPMAATQAAPAPTAVHGLFSHCNPCCHGGWKLNGGASLYFLKPYFGDDPAFITTTTSAVTGAIIAPGRVTTQFDWDNQPAGAFWLGVTGENGLGVRGRYFHFDQSSNTLNTSNPTPVTADAITTIAPPETLVFGPAPIPGFGSPGILGALTPVFGNVDMLTFNSDLKVQVLDLEATLDMQQGQWLVQLSAGARYLHMAQNYRGRLDNTVDTGVGVLSETQLLTFGHNFDGWGPTAALQASYRVGQSGLSLFGNVRGSILVGRTSENLRFVQTLSDPAGVLGGDVLIDQNANRSRNTTRPTVEVELGAEYGLDWGRLRPFLRGAVVSQTYFDAGSASQTDGNLSLFGAQVTLGFNY
jgi:hypothetical protein